MFTEAQISQVNLDTKDQHKLSMLGSNPAFSDIDLIVFADPSEFFVSENAKVQLPRSGKQSAILFAEEVESGNGHVWVAGFGEGGRIELHTDRNGNRFGQIRTNDRGFLIEDMGGGLSALIELEPKLLSELHCSQDGSPLEKSKPHPVGRVPAGRSVCDNEIEVLFAYSTNAQNSGLNINNIANQVIWQANYASGKSGIGSDISFKKVGTWHYSDFTETNSMFKDRLKIDEQVVVDEREYYGADMVVLLANGPNYGTTSQGYAYLIEVTNPIHSGCIVHVSYAAVDYAATHEMGHLIGGRHESDPDPNDAHAYQFYNKATIMSSGTIRMNPSYYIIPRWSKPSPYYAPYGPGPQPPWYGHTYGNSSCCNVAKKLKDRACAVAAFGDQLGSVPYNDINLSSSQIHDLEQVEEVFPNPTLSSVNFGAQWDGKELDIYPLSGVSVLTKRKVQDGASRLDDLPAGVYMIKSPTTIHKVIKL